MGLSVPGGAEAEFTALKDLKGASIHNGSASPMAFTFIVQLVDGESDKAANASFASIEIPAGYTQRLTVADWPDATSLLVENDADGDGLYESSQTVPANKCMPQDLDRDGFAETCMNGLSLWLHQQTYIPMVSR
jgi:hypothetical protein